MTNKEALKIASWLVVDELCNERTEYCGRSCIECCYEVQERLRQMALDDLSTHEVLCRGQKDIYLLANNSERRRRMTSYNELRDGQEFYGNGYKEGYKEGYKQAIIDGKTNFSRPQGKWRLTLTGDVICSVCKLPRRDTRTDHIQFCNHCGADMRGNNEKRE